MPAHPRPASRTLLRPAGLALAAALGLGADGCLPDDERPPPGVVTVWLEGAEGLEQRVPFVTDDGWSITFDRVFVASSGVDDEDGDEAEDGASPCTFYYDTEMRAVYDVAVPGPRLLGHFGGLGECDVEVEWGRFGLSPDVLGPGVSTDDVRSIVVNAILAGSRGAPALYVTGAASKGDRRKSFAWPFSRRFTSGLCGLERDEPFFRRHLGVSAALDAVVTVHPEWLFADALDLAAARLRFDPLAAADDRGDGDGQVTRAELEQHPLIELTSDNGTYTLPPDTPPFTTPSGTPRPPALLDFVNLQAGHTFYNDGRDPCAGPDPAE
jgi:hypothetical protein